MAIGERIRFFRMLRGMTQKHLGMTVGFPEKSADVRLAAVAGRRRESGGRIAGNPNFPAFAKLSFSQIHTIKRSRLCYRWCAQYEDRL